MRQLVRWRKNVKYGVMKARQEGLKNMGGLVSDAVENLPEIGADK